MSFETAVYIASFFGIFLTVFYALGIISDSRREKKLSKKSYRVSVIIPAFNEAKVIAKTIKSILASDYPKEKLEILVVDDGSGDKTYEIAKRFESETIKVFTKPNGGKGSAINFALKRARGELIVTMDADTVVETDTLKNMVAHFHSDEVMSVTPGMLVQKPRTIWQRLQQIEYTLGVFLRKAFSTMNAIHVTPGAFAMYRKKFFDRHGGFDETSITEDMEVALRIQKHHYTIENCPEATVYTMAPFTFRELMIQRRRWYVGMIRHLIQYYFLFRPKYGILGVLILPIGVLSVFATIIMTSYTLSRSINTLQEQISTLSAINFDFANMVEFSIFSIGHFIYTLLSEPIFVLFLSFVILMTIVILFAKKKTRFKDSFKFSLLIFLALFSLLFSFWWVMSFFYFIFFRKIAWREKKHYG